MAPDRLRTVADDAAHRAADAYSHAVVTGGAPAARVWLDTDPWLDTVRRAARADGDPRVVGRPLNSSDQARARLARVGTAWKHGGQPASASSPASGGQPTLPPRTP